MLYLNNPLLNVAGIIDALCKVQSIPEGSDRPSEIIQLKQKLMNNFFEKLKGGDAKKKTY